MVMSYYKHDDILIYTHDSGNPLSIVLINKSLPAHVESQQ